MGSLPLLLECDECHQFWITGGMADPGDFGTFCGSCLLREDLKWFRSRIDAGFGKLLNDNSLQTIAEFQCGGLTLLKRRMKYDLFVLLLVGSPHGARTCFDPFVWYEWGDVMSTIFLYYCGHDGVPWAERFSTIPKSDSETESL